MASGADNERSSVLQSGAAEFLNRTGLAEIDRNVTILHRRLKRVAQITLRCDLDLRFRTGELRDHLPHSAFGANEQHARARCVHHDLPSPYPLPKGEVDDEVAW